MKLAPHILLTLLVLVPYTVASSSNTFADAALDLQDPAQIPQIPQTAPEPTGILKKFLDFIDYDSNVAFEIGVELRKDTLNATMETSVTMINEKLGHFIKQGLEASTAKGIKENLARFAIQGHEISSIADCKNLNRLIMQRFDSAAAVMAHGFLDGSNLDIPSLVKTAITLHAINLLRTLTSLYVWSTPEQLHWFLAFSYNSTWYDPHLWQTHQTNWSSHLEAIRQANNIAFVRDLLMGQIASFRPFDFGQKVLLDLIAEYDLDDVYCSLNFTNHEQLATRLKTLAESGSFKILQFLAESQSIDLHLEKYSHPKKLPKDIADFELFWIQGYQYLPISYFLEKACENGRVDILDFFYRLNPKILKTTSHLTLAAKNGHLNVLEWASSHYLLADNVGIVKALIQGGHSNVLEWALSHNLFDGITDIAQSLILGEQFRILKQLQGKVELSTNDAQKISNEAAKEGRLNVVKWLHGKFKIIPKECYLGHASVEMLEWIESASLKKFTFVLALHANQSTLKWLLGNHPHLLTDAVKLAHYGHLADVEKIRWMNLQGWIKHSDIKTAIRVGETEVLRLGYSNPHIQPTKFDAITAVTHGHETVLKFFYSINPYCLDFDVFSAALKYGHLELAKYLESILRLKEREVTTVNVDLGLAFKLGNLELIAWVYWYYKLDELKDCWLQKAIEHGHLHIIDWAIMNQFCSKNNAACKILG